jgi:hypothetical protein
MIFTIPLPSTLTAELDPPVLLQLRGILISGCSVEADRSSCTITDRTEDYRQCHVQNCASMPAAITSAVAAWTDGIVRHHSEAPC